MAKLTEQDILNWNGDESDYMNADQLEFFRERLLQMQQAGRMPALLGYWPEIQAKANEQGLSPDSLMFYPIQGAPEFQSIYIGCSATPEGREVIRSVNKLLNTLGPPPVSSLDSR